MRNKWIAVLLMLLCSVIVPASVWADENAEAYLREYFGVSFEGEVSAEAFNAALTAIGADPLETETLTLADAAVGAVRLANLEELALACADKAGEILADEEVTVDEAYAPYVAVALKQDLADDDYDFSGPVSGKAAAEMLYRAAEISGKARHYAGRISDDSILSELQSAMSSVMIYDDEMLSESGVEILARDATTGFSLKYGEYDARFLEENTLRYGHDSITHILQLVALMKNAGMDAYVQIEPKVSVYEYMPEWGTPSAPTPTYAVREMLEGRFFAFAREFDVAFEFDSAAEKEAFHGLVESYAKKYDDSFDADGNLVKPLLASSWWQPLYFSKTAMENEEFMPLVDNVIAYPDDTYSIHSFSLEENSAAVSEAAVSVDTELTVTPVTIYVNPAFYRYITDTDHQ